MKPPSLAENLRMIWRLRPLYRAYLLPALGLLLLALVQADLALTATTAGQRVIDAFVAEDATPAVVPHGGARTVSERGFSALTGDAGATELAVWMAVFLVVAQALAIAIEQVRTLVSESFRHRVQSRLLAAFATELSGTRALRSAGNSSQIFTLDASQLSGILIFETVAAFENVVKLSVYVFGLSRIANGPLIVAVALPVTLLFQTAVARIFARRQALAIERSETLNVQMRSHATEFFDVLGRLVYFRGEQAHAKRLLDLSRASAQASRGFQLVSSMQGAVMGIVTMLSLPLVVALLSMPILIAMSGEDVSAGTIVQAQALFMLLTVSTSALVGIPSSLAQASPSVRRVEEILRIPPPEEQPSEIATLRGRQSAPTLSVSDLCFQYAHGDPVLRDLSFDIPAGACVGIVGGSGSGKTTLARVLLGDLLPTSGRIEYDGTDVTRWHLWWRRQLIGMLPAEQGFVRGTLEENVLFGRLREDVQDYERALEVSGVAGIARAHEKGGGMQLQIDARVEDFLSTGERRRVGIARLLVGDQRLWIFDEPGSGLDARTMSQVSAALAPGSEVLRGRTTLIITHDPDVFSTDFNLFVQGGKLAGVGTHDTLLRTSSDYASLVGRHAQERVEAAAPAIS